jgi:ankyrin repeat protein
MDLLPSMEDTLIFADQANDKDQAPSPLEFHVSGPSRTYILNIYDHFSNANFRLVERLGEANWQRHIALRNGLTKQAESVTTAIEEAPKSVFNPVSLFRDSGLGSSLPAQTSYAPTFVSHTSFVSSQADEDGGGLKVPPTPKAVSKGIPFSCEICGQTLSQIKNRIDWKYDNIPPLSLQEDLLANISRRHVFADLKPHICTFSDCKDALRTFPTREMWETHEFDQHRFDTVLCCSVCSSSFPMEEREDHLQVAHGILLEKKALVTSLGFYEQRKPHEAASLSCPLCLCVPGESRRNFVTHVGKHMESVALAALPRENDSDSESDSDIGSAITTSDVHLTSKQSDGTTLSLLSAVRSRNEWDVKLLLATGQVEADSRDAHGRTPLWWATRNGDEAIVKLLLATGQVKAGSKGDWESRTPLSLAAEGGHLAIAKLLLATGQAEANWKDDYGRTPLLWATKGGHEAIVKLLLVNGQVKANSKDNYGQTPLSWAAQGGHEAIVKLLLATSQVEADSKDNDGQTPLSWAAQGGHEAIVKLLLATGQVEANSKDNYGRTPLSWAAQGGHEAIVKLLLTTSQVKANSEDNNGRTPLLWAAQGGHEAIVKLLLNTSQIWADLKDNYSRTPLSWAAQGGHEAIVKLLLETGQVSADSVDNDSRTPLSWAAGLGHEKVVRLLLNRGAEMESKESNGRTPLSWAAGYGQEKVIRLLLDRGAEMESKDNHGRTPLSWAARYGQEKVIRLLLEKGAEIKSEDRDS